MKRTYMQKPAEVKRDWWVVDASGKSLGRMAAKVAVKLMGKDKPTYTPHIDGGDYVIIVNAAKVKVQNTAKVYTHWSGYPGGLKEIPFHELVAKKPVFAVRNAVRRMLPKNLLAKKMLRKLKVYESDKHPHAAQQPKPLAI
ncbi:MAG: 50S ribosomal protein L13 [Planctomycetota bacterium]|nr:50S ribosomal protein L13 [Planctomycetota bacterium]